MNIEEQNRLTGSGILVAILFCIHLHLIPVPARAFESIELSRDVDSVRISPDGRFAVCWSIASSDELLLIRLDPLSEVGRIALAPSTERVSGVAFDDEWLILKTKTSLQTYRLSQFVNSESQPEPFATTTTDSPSNLVVPVGKARSDGLVATEVYLGRPGSDGTVRYSLPGLDPLPRRFSSLIAYHPPRQFGSTWLIEGCHHADPSEPPSALYWRPRHGAAFHHFSQTIRQLSLPRVTIDLTKELAVPESAIYSSRTVAPYDGRILITALRTHEKEAFVRVYDRGSRTLIHESDLGFRPLLPMSLSSTSWTNVFRATPTRFVIAKGRELITDAWTLTEPLAQPLQIERKFPTRLVLKRSSQARLSVIGGVPPYEIKVNNRRNPDGTVRFDSDAIAGEVQRTKPVNEVAKQASESAFRVLAGRAARGSVIDVVTDATVKDAAGNVASASFVTLVEVPRTLVREQQQQQQLEQQRESARIAAQRQRASTSPTNQKRGIRYDLTGTSPVPLAIMLMVVPVLAYCGAWFWQSRRPATEPSRESPSREKSLAFSGTAETILYLAAVSLMLVGITILVLSRTADNIRFSPDWVSTAYTLIGSGALLLFTPSLLPRRGGTVLLVALACIGFSLWCYFDQYSGLGGIWIGGFGLAGCTGLAIGIIMLTHKDPQGPQDARRQPSGQLRQADDHVDPASKAAIRNQSPAENRRAEGIATLGSRIGAYTIDVLLILPLVLAVCWGPFGFGEAIAERFRNPDDVDSHVRFLEARNWVRDLSFFIYIIYCTFLEASTLQGSLGKRVVHLRVCDIQGQRITLIRSLIRNLCKILSYATLGIGFFIAVGSERRQTLHDLIVGTVVMEDNPGPTSDT